MAKGKNMDTPRLVVKPLETRELGLCCSDCHEPILESERHGIVHCEYCHMPLHGECRMVSPMESDYCGRCYTLLGVELTRKMKGV